MHSKKIATVLAAFLFLSNPALAQKWGAHVDVEAKPGSKRTIGEADFFLPLVQDDRSLFFGNARLRAADHDNREGNLGLGYRRMLDGGWNLGAYGYYDRRRSETGQKYNQATFGAEALGRDWDLRGNMYLPQGDRVRELGTTTAGGTPTAAIVGTTVQVTTPGSTTFTSEERALKGYDLEAGWRVPVWAAEADKQLRLYAGGYHFSDGGVRVSGPRVRAELAMYDLPALWKGAQLMLGAEYQDDNARGGQGFVSARIRIPLGSEKSSGSKMNWQERRMTAPTVRDVDVVTQARSVVTATTPAVVETATQTAGGQALTVLDSGTTTGAALPGAVATAGANSLVVLSGTFIVTGTTTLGTGQTLMGAGTLTVATPSGLRATLTTPAATVSGFGVGPGMIALGTNSTLSGLDLRNTGSGSAVLVPGGVSGATIANNSITVSSGNSSVTGLRIANIANNTGATIRDNTIIANSSPGNTAIALFISGGVSVNVSGNTLSASGGALNYHTAFSSVTPGTTAIQAGSTGNMIASGTCFVAVGANASGPVGYTNGTTCP